MTTLVRVILNNAAGLSRHHRRDVRAGKTARQGKHDGGCGPHQYFWQVLIIISGIQYCSISVLQQS
jgi:hypothetical protein